MIDSQNPATLLTIVVMDAPITGRPAKARLSSFEDSALGCLGGIVLTLID